MVQAPRPNAGRAKKPRKNQFFFLKKEKLPKKIFFLDIPSSYAKILGETNFHSREFPRSGKKAKDGKEEKKKEKKPQKLVITMA